jgi:hypothetical protein
MINTLPISRYANKFIRKEVEWCSEFRNSNGTVFGIRHEDAGIYAVYSYGDHWPLWVYDWNASQWYENVDTYGNTTTRHASCTRPYDLTKSAQANGFISMSCSELKTLIDNKIYTARKAA